MVSSRSQLQRSEFDSAKARPARAALTAPAAPAPTARWTSTFAFIKDQLLQFWPPYRHEVHDDSEDANGDPSPGKSEKPTTRSP